MSERELDQAKTDAFAVKMVGILNGAALALMTSIGRQTGLFEAMATLPPSTSEAIAAAARLEERYVREWLGAMVTGGIVEFDSVPAHLRAASRARGRPHQRRRRPEHGQVHAVHPHARRGRSGRHPKLPQRRRRALRPLPALPGLDGRRAAASASTTSCCSGWCR